MRDFKTSRSGFDRVLLAVAATFLTVSAGAATAQQTASPRDSVSELAIDAAVPRPEPANVAPPTASEETRNLRRLRESIEFMIWPLTLSCLRRRDGWRP